MSASGLLSSDVESCGCRIMAYGLLSSDVMNLLRHMAYCLLMSANGLLSSDVESCGCRLMAYCLLML